MEGDGGKTADIAFSTQVAVVFFGDCSGRSGHSDPHGTLRIALVSALCETGRGDGESAPGQTADTVRHGRRNLAADHSVPADNFARNTEHFLLDGDGV